jgi:recombinational DNA repair protein (RecF pathway)
VLARVIERVTADVPGLGPEAALAAVIKAGAHHPKALRQLDAYLVTHRSALGNGPSDCPVSFVRLAHTLADVGYAVALPRCAECGRSPRYLRSSPGGRLCAPASR